MHAFQDGKTKLDHVQDLLTKIVFQKKLPFKRVLMDSCYGTQRLMALIDNWGKFYYTPLKKNRLVDETSGKEKYQIIDELSWSELDIQQGKLIKIKKFPKDKKLNYSGLLFLPIERNTLLPMRLAYQTLNRYKKLVQIGGKLRSSRWKSNN